MAELFDFNKPPQLPAGWTDALRGAHGPVAVRAHSPSLLNDCLRTAQAGDAQLITLPSHFHDSQVEALVQRHGFALVLAEGEAVPELPTPPAERATGALGLFTSGTSGEPKLAFHRWQRIGAPGRFAGERLPGSRWLMAYSPLSYAGLQVFFAVQAAKGQVLYCDGPTTAPQAIVDADLNVISATPTYWRMLANAWPTDLPTPQLQQATLGGERVDQSTLDLVQRLFSPAKLTHIYASTEVGSAIVVSDGREGFPVHMLERDGRVGLRVRDGQLEVRSPYRMLGYGAADGADDDGDWYRTPDLAEIRDGRVYIVGRSDAVVNVGGAKIPPEEVEAAVNRIPGVRDSRVFLKRSPIIGSLLSAEVALEDGAELAAAELKATLREHLPANWIPQYLVFTSDITLNANGKKSRR